MKPQCPKAGDIVGNKYYSIKEAAKELGISRTYVYYLRNVGRIKVDKIGSQYVISREEIERYKNSKEEK